MLDKTKAPKRSIKVEFGSDEFLDAFHAVMMVIREERETMEKRHNRMLDLFLRDIKLFKKVKDDGKEVWEIRSIHDK